MQEEAISDTDGYFRLQMPLICISNFPMKLPTEFHKALFFFSFVLNENRNMKEM